MIAVGRKIEWESVGPRGHVVVRRGTVRGRLTAGEAARLPKGAKFRAEVTNYVHARYLVEVERVDGRNGKKLASLWMAPKAVTLEAAIRSHTHRRHKRPRSQS